MPPSRRGRLPHVPPPWVPEGSLFFITVCTQPRGENQLARPGPGEAVLRAAAFQHARHAWFCRLLLLMPDHLHAILAVPRDPGLATTVTHWKRFLARQEGIGWQRDFFDHRLRDHHEEGEKISYILQNPVRRGLVARAEDWPWVYRPNDRPPPRW